MSDVSILTLFTHRTVGFSVQWYTILQPALENNVRMGQKPVNHPYKRLKRE